MKTIISLLNQSTIVLLLLSLSLQAQQYSKSENNADIVEYTYKEGLPTTQIRDLVHSRDGYIWLSGSEGTYRFDGYNFDEVGKEIGLHQMQAMYYDSTTDVFYFASPERFIVFDGKEYKIYGEKEGYRINGLPGKIINFVKADSKGRIWVGAETRYVDKEYNGGLTYFSDGVFTVFDSTNFPLDNADYFIETPYGDLIFSSSGHNTQTRVGSYIALYKDDLFKRIDPSVGVQLQNARLQGDPILHAIDKEGNTWIAFRGTANESAQLSSGVLMYDGKSFHSFPGLTKKLKKGQIFISLFYSKEQDKIFATTFAFGGITFSASNETIFEYKNDRWIVSDIIRDIKYIKELKSNKIIKDFKYVGSVFAKANRFFPEHLTFFSRAFTQSSKYPNQKYTFTNGHWEKYDAFPGIVIGETEEGLSLINSKGFSFFYPNRSKMLTDKDGLLLTQSGIPDLYSDRNGIVWISYSYTNIPAYARLSDVGLNVWDGNSLRTITTSEGLPSNITFDTYQDRNNRIWVPTSKGIALGREIQNSDGEWIFKFEAIPSSGKYGYNTTDLLETTAGDIFVLQNYVRPGHKDKGLADGLKDKSPKNLKADFYLGRYNGKVLETLKSPFAEEKSRKPYQLYRMLQDLKGHLWLLGIFADKKEALASAKSEIKIYDGKSWQNPPAKWGMPTDQLHYVGNLFDDIYFLTVDGFYKFDGNTFINLIDSVNVNADFRILKGASVAGTSTHIQSGKRLFIRLRRKGLVVYDGVNIKYYTRKNGLPSVNLSNPNTDENGHLFFGTPSGALVIEDGNFRPYYSDENVVSGGAYAVTMDRNRDLVLFYNGVGLYIAKMENRKYPLKISSLRINESDYFYTYPKELEHNRNSFVFNYAAFNYKNPRQTQYEHFLNGYDLNWSRASNLSFAEYQNLPHGDYEFKARGITANGAATNEVSHAFTILPPLWLTWYAYLSYIVLFGLMLLSIRQYEKRRLRLKEADKRRREQEEAKILESELRAEAAEMQAKAAEMQAKAAEAQNRATQIENERKTKELEEARTLQLSLLPKDVPLYPGYQISAYMKTATEVGGDYYDFSTKKDGSLNVAIGDATGHGMKAGTLVTAMKALFSSGSTEVDMEAFFLSVNKGLKKMQMERVSMSFAMLNINDHTVKMINAGMPPIYLYRKKTNKVEEIELNGMPLGAMEKAAFSQKELKLANGDTILLMSDGVPELRKSDGEIFGYERVVKAFTDVVHQSTVEIVEHLKNTGSAWVDDMDPEDDVTFVVIKAK